MQMEVGIVGGVASVLAGGVGSFDSFIALMKDVKDLLSVKTESAG